MNDHDISSRGPRASHRLAGFGLVLGMIATGALVASPAALADGGNTVGGVRGYVAAISSGGSHSCVVTTESTVKCWGYNSSGELGAGDIQAIGNAPGEMGSNLPIVNLGAGRTARAVDVGTAHVAGVGMIPAAVSGIVLNVTGVTGPPGFVSAWPTGAPLPTASTVNFSEQPIDTRANGAWLPVGVGGKVSYYTLNGSHILADAAGYFLV